MPMNTCGDARCLLATYRAALAEYDRVRCAAFQSLAPDYITLQEAVQARKDAQIAVLRARKAYWRHVEEHFCRRVVADRTSKVGTTQTRVTISLHLT